jgi:hypothetical protein
MNYSTKYARRLKKYSYPLIQSNPYLLSAKSSYRLLFKRRKEYNTFNYPLLVTSGLQRSGTHLLDNLLRNHHQILSYYGELQIGKPNKYHWPDLEDETNLKKRFAALLPRNMVRNYLGLRKYHKSNSAHDNFIFDFNFFRKIFLELEKKNENFIQRNTLNNFFTAYFNAYLNCNHSNFYNQYKYIVAPVPGLTIMKKSIEGFFKDYPDGKIFVLIREPLIWWNSARKHTKNLKNNGLERYEKTLANTRWAFEEFKNRVFAVSFDYLIKNPAESVNAILKNSGLEFNHIATYPSKFPNYANDNSTFGHKRTKAILKDKIKREVNIPQADRLTIETKIFPLYEAVLESCTINPVKD